jgi:hypothetical protein
MDTRTHCAVKDEDPVIEELKEFSHPESDLALEQCPVIQPVNSLERPGKPNKGLALGSSLPSFAGRSLVPGPNLLGPMTRGAPPATTA